MGKSAKNLSWLLKDLLGRADLICVPLDGVAGAVNTRYTSQVFVYIYSINIRWFGSTIIKSLVAQGFIKSKTT